MSRTEAVAAPGYGSGVLDYDGEAWRYDQTRGGDARASAAASAIENLLPGYAVSAPAAIGAALTGSASAVAGGSLGRGAGILDVACGTGIVTACLRRAGRKVFGLDRSPGMLTVAAGRLEPGAAVHGDAAALPFVSGSLAAVVMIWLLHLVPDPASMIAEAARVLGPGGVFITTVDKSAGHFATPSDIAPIAAACSPAARDGFGFVSETASRHGLTYAGDTTFPGIGQGRSPRQLRDAIVAGTIRWTDPAAAVAALDALPGQDSPRPEPVYRLASFARR